MMEKLDKTELACFIRCSSDKSLYNRYIKLYKKIDRLNNIIRELENTLIDDMLFIDELYNDSHYLSIEEFKKQHPYTAGSYDHCVETINKLQELKRKKEEE